MSGRSRLLEDGQRRGTCRDDQPVEWLLTTLHALMHSAAEEISAVRLDPTSAGPLLQTSLLAAYAPPPAPL